MITMGRQKPAKGLINKKKNVYIVTIRHLLKAGLLTFIERGRQFFHDFGKEVFVERRGGVCSDSL